MKSIKQTVHFVAQYSYKKEGNNVFKLGNILIVLGMFLIHLSAIGGILDFLPNIINSYYLASTGTVFTASGILFNNRKQVTGALHQDMGVAFYLDWGIPPVKTAIE